MYNYQGFDPGLLLSAFNAARQAKEQENQFAFQKQMAERQAAFQEAKVANELEQRQRIELARRAYDAGNPEWLRQVAPDEYLKLEDAKQPKLGSDWVNAANQVIGPITPEKLSALTPEQMSSIARAMTQGQKNRSSNVTVSVGANGQPTASMPLTVAEQTSTQNQLTNIRDTLYQIDQLEKLGSPSQFLGIIPRAGNAWRSGKAMVAPSWMSKEEVDQLQKARQFSEINEGIFNAYRKVITGAGASEKELEQLRSTIMNTNLDPMSYQAALDRLKVFGRRAEYVYSKMLREGIDVSDPGYGTRFDLEMSRTADVGSQPSQPQQAQTRQSQQQPTPQAVSPQAVGPSQQQDPAQATQARPSARDRAIELRKSGMNAQQIEAQLKQEGLL